EYDKSRQLFIRTHNKAPIFVAIHVSNPNRSPARIQPLKTQPQLQPAFAEIVSDYFPVPHVADFASFALHTATTKMSRLSHAAHPHQLAADQSCRTMSFLGIIASSWDLCLLRSLPFSSVVALKWTTPPILAVNKTGRSQAVLLCNESSICRFTLGRQTGHIGCLAIWKWKVLRWPFGKLGTGKASNQPLKRPSSTVLPPWFGSPREQVRARAQ